MQVEEQEKCTSIRHSWPNFVRVLVEEPPLCRVYWQMHLLIVAVFLIGYAQSDTSANCPPTNYTSRTGVVTSPNYPADYDNNEECIYIIYAPQDYHVEITFLEFDTETCCDYLFLYKGTTASADHLITRLEGTTPKGHTYSSTDDNIMMLRFVSDLTNTASGFLGNYTVKSNSPTSASPAPAICPMLSYFAPAGSIQSPGYPNNYPNNANCDYLITVPSGVVSLTIVVFETEGCCDFLSLYDGSDKSARLIKKLSGLVPYGTNYRSTQSMMFAEFVSDISNTYPGFYAQFESAQ